jgi:NAD(P)-dependent dehydrogenase (short-subunit alcohol dehydrogenase family)
VTVDGFDLRGKRALVVGAETRVGRVIAGALAEAGARLALASGPDTRGAGGEALLSPNGSEHLTIAGSPDDLVRVTIEELGGLDVVANCADLRLAGPFEQLSDGEWDQLVAVNLTGPVRLFRAAGREMKARGGGRLIQLVSMLGERGVPHTAAYGATQAGLLQLVRTLSLEWARSGIRVNGIGLGWLEGDPLLGQSTERLLRYLPTKRFGRPEEVGAIAVYLASDAADSMTGQTFWVDGAAMSHA